MNNSSPTYKELTVDYYDKHAKEYAQSVDDHYSTEQISTFLAMLPDNPKVLDAGCGSGRDVYIMHKAGAHAVGVDLSEGMIKYAREQYKDLEFHLSDVLTLPFEDDVFDGVWAHGILFHLETEEEVKKALKEFDRVLKKNGVLHVLVKLQKDSQKIKIFDDNPDKHPRIYRFFQKEELNILLGEAGFESIILETYDENERNPKGRHDVTWLHSLSRKVS